MKKDKKEITSSLTHLAGALLALAGTVRLAVCSFGERGAGAFVSVLIFGVSMVLLYSASSLYHWSCAVQARAASFMQRLDHIAIFLLIAGTYTPLCVIALGRPLGYILLALVWSVAAAGLLMKIFWMDAPLWLSCSLYLAMGWLAAPFIVPLARALPLGATLWLIAGGLLYTAGALIFGFERPRIRLSWFGSHELFHLFVIGGSLCHYISVARCIA
ncbi:MAG: hemolysin III family protein [Synergistaceae bacterium]|nr:hemolysin III family protein [Synergistaceae bacterium]